jgi:hypothetical protein
MCFAELAAFVTSQVSGPGASCDVVLDREGSHGSGSLVYGPATTDLGVESGCVS